MQPAMLSEETKAKAVGVLQGHVYAKTSLGKQKSPIASTGAFCVPAAIYDL